MAESEHDGSLRSQSDNEKTRRNKRKMARPKRLAPSNDPVSLGLHDNADSETEVGDEQRATSRSKVDRAAVAAAASISAIQNRPLDLRSSAEAIDDVIEAASRGVTVVTRQSPPSPSNALVTSDVDLNCLSTTFAMDDGGFSSEDATTTTTTTDVTGYLGNADAGEKARHDVIRKNSSSSGGGGGSNKHMTRQRRIEANARERTRVHTISAAFESLRRAVPSYAYNQRLSKLAILRIACSYIVALGRLADLDCDRSEGGDGGGGGGGGAEDGRLDFAECVDICTRTIQAEGRAKRRN